MRGKPTHERRRARSPCAVTQFLRIWRREPQGGKQSEDKWCRAGGEQAGDEHALVHLHVGEAELVAAKPLQRGDAPRGEDHADESASR